MDRGPLKYDRWGIIKHRVCVENVPQVERMESIKQFNGPPVHIMITLCKQKKFFLT